MSKTISLFALICILSVMEIPIHGMELNLNGQIITLMLTPFNDQGKLHLVMVSRLAKYCAENNLTNIYLLEFSADSASLTLSERIAYVTEWVKQAIIYGLKLIVEVGLQPLVDAIRFAKFCSKQNTSALAAIAYFPEYIYEADTRQEIIEELKLISKAAPSIPLICDELLSVDPKVGTKEIYQIADQVPTLAVIETNPDTYLDLEAVSLKRNLSFWIYNMQYTHAALLFGLKSTSIAPFLFPNTIKAMEEAAKNCDRNKLRDYQATLNSWVVAITDEREGSTIYSRTYFSRLRVAFELISGIPVGIRAPFEKVNSTVYDAIASCLTTFGITLAIN